MKMINAYISTPVAVATNNAIPFEYSRAKTRSGCRCNGGWLHHDDGSALFEISAPGIYKVDFNAQLTAAASGNVTLAMVGNGGEVIPGTQMGESILATGITNVGMSALIVVPCGGSLTLAVRNTSDATVNPTITVNSASIVITREA